MRGPYCPPVPGICSIDPLAVQAHPERYPAHAKVASILNAVSEELHDVPLYYNLHDLCKTVHCSPPAADVFRSGLVNAGAPPHALPGSCRPSFLVLRIQGQCSGLSLQLSCLINSRRASSCRTMHVADGWFCLECAAFSTCSISVGGVGMQCLPASQCLRQARVGGAGYRVSSTHANPLGIKTDAPPAVVWDIIRGWVAMHPVKRGSNEDSYAAKLLAKPAQLKANFARAAAAISAAKSQKVARFLPNPEKNWGPKPKAHRTIQVWRLPSCHANDCPSPGGPAKHKHAVPRLHSHAEAESVWNPSA